MKKKEVAIVIPLSFNCSFSETEKLSLKHLEYFLPHFDTYFLAPEGINISFGQIRVMNFDPKFFGSAQAHAKFCLSNALFSRFSSYEYIMMHHLDCLVFKDNLSDWCRKGYDFIGPPWIKGPDKPKLKHEGVGNGGLSLMRVEGFLRLLNSPVKWKKFRFELKNLKRKKSSVRKRAQSLYHAFTCGNSVLDHIEHYTNMGGTSDTFLFTYGKIYDPKLNIPSVEEALKFGFEINPRICFERNNRQLPFGVHRWEVYDKDFWKPYILKTP